MKKLVIMMFMVLCLAAYAEELKENKYYELGKAKVNAGSAVYPVLQMIEAYMKNDLEKAKENFTEAYMKDVKDRTQGFKVLMEQYSKDRDTTKRLRFKFYPHKSGDGSTIVKISYFTKDNYGAVRFYRVKKIKDKWLIDKD